jgi:hypothetical protein
MRSPSLKLLFIAWVLQAEKNETGTGNLHGTEPKLRWLKPPQLSLKRGFSIEDVVVTNTSCGLG